MVTFFASLPNLVASHLASRPAEEGTRAVAPGAAAVAVGILNAACLTT